MPYTFVEDYGSFKKGQHVVDAPIDAISAGFAVAVKTPVVTPVIKPVVTAAEKPDVSHLDGAQLRSGDLTTKVG